MLIAIVDSQRGSSTVLLLGIWVMLDRVNGLGMTKRPKPLDVIAYRGTTTSLKAERDGMLSGVLPAVAMGNSQKSTSTSQHGCCLSLLVKRWRLSWLGNIRSHPDEVALLAGSPPLQLKANRSAARLWYRTLVGTAAPRSAELGAWTCWFARLGPLDVEVLGPQFWCWSTGDNGIQKLARILLPSQ